MAVDQASCHLLLDLDDHFAAYCSAMKFHLPHLAPHNPSLQDLNRLRSYYRAAAQSLETTIKVQKGIVEDLCALQKCNTERLEQVHREFIALIPRDSPFERQLHEVREVIDHCIELEKQLIKMQMDEEEKRNREIGLAGARVEVAVELPQRRVRRS